MARRGFSAARTTRFSVEQLTRLRGLAVSLLAATAAVFGQTFKSAADLVTIPVTVTNRAGSERVRDLAADQFRVFEEGVEQDVAVVSKERRPISLCIVLDSSMSMRGAPQRLARNGISPMVAGLEPDDEIAFVVFSDRVQVPVTWTRVSAFPQIDWDKWKPSSHTALLDGLRQSLDLMDAAHNPRTAVLLVSDGGENASALTFADVVKTRRQSETLVYAFWLLPGGNLGPPMRGSTARLASDVLMSDVVGDSGGRTYAIESGEQAERSAAALLDDLRNEYLLGYAPRKPPDGKYRRLRVEMRNPDLRVRARQGYLAVPR